MAVSRQPHGGDGGWAAGSGWAGSAGWQALGEGKGHWAGSVKAPHAVRGRDTMARYHAGAVAQGQSGAWGQPGPMESEKASFPIGFSKNP